MPEHEIDNPIYWRDEILQVMFWMSGEGFGQEFSAGDLKKFLAAEDSVLAGNLELLVTYGFLEHAGGGNKYALTDLGKREGGRRFADEFDEMLKPGHYECNDPDCDCHDPESLGECKHLIPQGISQ